MDGDVAEIHYFQFRYDCRPDYNHERWYEEARQIMSVLIKEDPSAFFGTFNIEVFSKLGDACKPHLHFNFAKKFSGVGKDTPEKYCMRTRAEFTRTGSWFKHTEKCYMFKHLKDVRDIHGHFRYALKKVSKNVDKHFWNKELFLREVEGWDTKLQLALAQNEVAKCEEVGKAKRAKELGRQTTYERMLDACADSDFVGHRDVFRWVLEWLDQEGIPPDSNKVKSFVNGIALKKGLLSPDQYYNELFR